MYELTCQMSVQTVVVKTAFFIVQLAHILLFPWAMKGARLFVVYDILINCNIGEIKYEYVL